MNTLTITFKKSKGAAYSYKFELDEERNAGLTEFDPATTCYLKLYNTGRRLEIDTTSGTASVNGTKITEDKEDFLVFEDTKQESLSYPVYKIESYSWVGRDGGSVVFDRYNANLPEETNGVLYVKYKTAYTSIKLVAAVEGKVLVIARDENGKGSVVVEYKSSLKDTYLTVKDACTKNVVAGARVYLDGKYVGNTNSLGKIYLGKLPTGKHKIKVSKAGYKNTDEDAIANDEFEVTPD